MKPGSRARIHNFTIPSTGSPPARGRRSRRRSATPAISSALEQQYAVEAVTTPAGVTHFTFTR